MIIKIGNENAKFEEIVVNPDHVVCAVVTGEKSASVYLSDGRELYTDIDGYTRVKLHFERRE